MQTFLPYSDFYESAACLDRSRLGKQRVETMQILSVLLESKDVAWSHHPAVLMWAGYENALALYGSIVCEVWSDSYEDGTASFFWPYLSSSIVYPPWLGDFEIHSSHRAALLYKDFKWYSQYGWHETPKEEYKWPITLNEKLDADRQELSINVGKRLALLTRHT